MPGLNFFVMIYVLAIVALIESLIYGFFCCLVSEVGVEIIERCGLW